MGLGAPSFTLPLLVCSAYESVRSWIQTGICSAVRVTIITGRRVEDPHKRYERKQVIWLFISFGLIALMAVGVMLLGAAQAGLLRRRW